jgi:hypothetical protein
VCKLPSLEVLELDETKQLGTLPSQISQLTSLQHLSLSLSEITSLPTQIGLLTQLPTLILNWCYSPIIFQTLWTDVKLSFHFHKQDKIAKKQNPTHYKKSTIKILDKNHFLRVYFAKWSY